MNIIQEIINGVAECPRLIQDEKDALKLFIKFAKDNELTKLTFKTALKRIENDPKELAEIINEIQESSGDMSNGYELLWFETDVE